MKLNRESVTKVVAMNLEITFYNSPHLSISSHFKDMSVNRVFTHNESIGNIIEHLVNDILNTNRNHNENKKHKQKI